MHLSHHFSPAAARRVGIYAALASVAAVAVSPLLALSYFAIPGGAEELRSSSVRAWAEPARRLLEPLVTWADPERVYATFVQSFALIFPAMLLTALAVRSRRLSQSRTERWGWRITIVTYAWSCLGLLLVAPLLLTDPGGDGAAIGVVFLAMMLPGQLFGALGSTVLGIGLLRNGFRPRATAWLLTLAFPSMIIIPTVLGHNSLGDLPVVLAWGIAGRTLIGHPARADHRLPHRRATSPSQ
jgi:hypothetical protein